MKRMKNLKSCNVQELSTTESENAQGGFVVGMIIAAFQAGLTYGYVKEKFDSGQWQF